jgi:RNA polymerase sigma-70 factor (ECF subfamily)
MSDVTRILSAIEQGDRRAAEQLLPLIYDELRALAARRLAQEKPGQTLQATALVHEAYLRLVDDEGRRSWEGRGHFFAAAEAMRRILIDNARRKRRPKHGDERQDTPAVTGAVMRRAREPTHGAISLLPTPGRRNHPVEHLIRLPKEKSSRCDLFGRPARLVIGGATMATESPSDTDALILAAARGDRGTRQELLARHRERLRRMVAVRMDRRLAPRIDPSDVVQEALAEADRRLDDYLRDRPLPLYPWLRQFACQRLRQLHRHHIDAGCRSVACEEPWELPLPDHSAHDLARCLLAGGTSPSRRLVRDEQRDRVRDALERLDPRDREVLVLRYLEGLTTGDIAAVLGVRAGAVKMRHLRALERLRSLLDAGSGGSEP